MDINKDILKNVDIDIDNGILQNIDIDKDILDTKIQDFLVFPCFFKNKILILIVNLSPFFEISTKCRDLFWEYQYEQYIDKSFFLKISI